MNRTATTKVSVKPGVVPAIGRLRQEDRYESEASLAYRADHKANLHYIVRHCPINKYIKKN